MSSLLRKILASATGVVLLACSDGTPFTPSVQTVAGSYHATTLTVSEGGSTTNLLVGGGFLDVMLHENGTTSGRLFLPGRGEEGGDFDVALPGTWSLTGNTVTFDQPDADTFLRDVTFTAELNRLSAEATFSGQMIRLILSK
jgi:hypothetical protein